MKFNKIILILLVAAGLFAGQSVLAHATPVNYSPESAAILTAPPERITIRFSERIDAPASNITIFAPDGSRADDSAPVVDSDDSHIFSVGFKAAGSGTYAVAWQVVSLDDGHFTKGAFSFSVGSQSANTQAVDQSSQIVFISKTNEGLATSAELMGQGLLWGTLIILAAFWRRLRQGNPSAVDSDKSKKVLTWLMVTGAILIALGSAAYVLIKSADLADVREIAFAPALKLFLVTAAGRMAMYRFVLSILFLGVFAGFRNRIIESVKLTKIEIILYLILLLASAARIASSHAVAADFLPPLTIADHFIHMIFKGAWVGIVIAASALLLPVILKTKDLGLSFPLLNRLSKFLTVVFGVVGITGAYIVWLDLKDPMNIQTTDWGVRFLILSAVGGILFLPRLYNQLAVQYGILKGMKKNDAGYVSKVMGTLKFGYPLEAVIGIALLVATGFIMITTPPVWHKNVFQRQAASQGETIILSEHPFETNSLKIALAGQSPVKDMVVTLTNLEKGIGPIVADLEQRSDSSFVLSKNQLSPAGQWQMEITAQKTQGYDATASFNLNYPGDVEDGRLEQSQRTFGLFEVIVIVNALGVAGLMLVLLYINNYFAQQFSRLQAGNVSYSIEPGSGLLPAVAGLAAAAVLAGIWFAAPPLAKSSFQRQCEADGNLWHNMVPIRGGVNQSQFSSPGCMLANGQFHISDFDEYKYFVAPASPIIQMIPTPETPVAGQTASLAFTIKDESGQPVKDLSVSHEKFLHTIIISEDFNSFAHVHAEDQATFSSELKRAGVFPLAYTFPKAGKYLIAVDFAVKAQSFSRTFAVEVAGQPGMDAIAQPNFAPTKKFGDYTVNVTNPEGFIAANRLATLVYTVDRNNQPVTDLAPYLGAPMHFAIVKKDLSAFAHTHGEVHLPGQPTAAANMLTHFHPPPPAVFGPTIDVHAVFPSPGVYYVFGEFKHNNQIITTRFEFSVE